MAPGANILLVETPVAETEGVTGFPQIVAAENYVINHNLGDVISQSFGATEQTFPNAQSIARSARRVPQRAVHNVTVLAPRATAAGSDANDTSDGAVNYYPFRVNRLAVQRPARDLGRRDAAVTRRERATARRPTACGTTRRCSAARLARRRWRPLVGVRPALLPEWRRGDRRRLARNPGRRHERGGQRWRARLLSVTPNDPAAARLLHHRRHERGERRCSPGSSRSPIRRRPSRLGWLNPALYALGDGRPGSSTSRRATTRCPAYNTAAVRRTTTVKGTTPCPGYDLASGLGYARRGCAWSARADASYRPFSRR